MDLSFFLCKTRMVSCDSQDGYEDPMKEDAKALCTVPHCDALKCTVLVIISILPCKFIYNDIKFQQIFPLLPFKKRSLEPSQDVLKQAWPRY